MATTVLIAEDDIVIRGLMAEFLRDFGYNVVEAGNADEVVAMFEAGNIVDLLFSDIRMPGSIDGLALARRVKDRWPATSVLLTSGYPGGSVDAENEIPTLFLPKPYPPLSLLSSILAIVEP